MDKYDKLLMAIIWKMPKFVMKITFFSLLIVPVYDKFCLLVKTAISVLENNSKIRKPCLFSLYQTPISITFSLPEYCLDLETLTGPIFQFSVCLSSMKADCESTDGIWAECKSWFAVSKWFQFSPDIFLTKLNQDGDLSNLVIYLIYHKICLFYCVKFHFPLAHLPWYTLFSPPPPQKTSNLLGRL